MNTAALTKRGAGGFSLGQRVTANRWRLTLFFAILALFAWDAELREIVMAALADAYFQVTVFVALTLATVFWFEKIFAFDLGQVMKNNLKWQPLIAAALGAIPGCGGAIIVVTQFTKGYASFGAFISVLVATMGDAAILLIARDPKSALIIICVSLVAGVITGMIVDRVHGREFMAVDPDKQSEAEASRRFGGTNDDRPVFSYLWFALIALAIVPAIAMALAYEPDEWFGSLAQYSPFGWMGFIAAMFCIALWSVSKRPGTKGLGADTTPDDALVTRVVKDTNFVTTWVIMAFLVYEVAAGKFGLDVGTLFQGWLLLVPTIAILVGFIPGCGPQVVVTTLYLAGAVPMSAQMSNAIANDGDALFPALALAPKAAVLATLYSAAPAFIVGYSWLFLFEL